MSRQIGTILLCTVLFAVSIAAAPTRQFYVAPDGDDGNPGTKSKPLQSFAGARDAVRREIADGMTADVVVQFAPGNYFTKATTTFDERDSGRDGHVVIYRGAPNCQTKIYGGLPVTAWEKDKDGWYKAKVTPKRVFYTLYENERAANGGSQGFTNLQEGNWRLEGETVFYRPRNLPTMAAQWTSRWRTSVSRGFTLSVAISRPVGSGGIPTRRTIPANTKANS